MVNFLNSEFIEELVVYGSCIGMNFGYAVYPMLQSYLMSKGLAPLFIITLVSLAASFFFLPFAVYFERKQWPQRFSLKLLWRLLLISIGSITLSQTLMIYGVQKTSPALATVVPNLLPGVIFLIASVLRYEKVDFKCIYSQMKILGTVVCIAGAIVMSLMHTIASTSNSAKGAVSEDNITSHIGEHRIVGTSCLLAGVIFMSIVVILQASTLRDFPAPISITVVTWFIGAISTGILEVLQDHSMEISSSIMSGSCLLGLCALGGILSGACGCITTWLIKKRGPVFVATFTPTNTAFSMILASIALKEFINLGSLVGMVRMFMGLYSVLWAKKKEGLADEELKVDDVREPLFI